MTANRDLPQNEPDAAGSNRNGGGRQAIWGIPPQWRIYFLIIFTIKMAAWAALVIRHELTHGDHATGMDLAMAVVDETADAMPLFAFTTILMLEMGAGLMITYNYLYNKIVQRVIDGHIAEGEAIGEERGIAIGEERGRAEGKAEGIAEGEARGIAIGEAQGEARGRAETEARMRAQFADWLARKEEAERQGVPFDEPMPGADPSPNGHSPQR